MRYTKAALLVFGLGLVIGLVVVVGEFSNWEYLASVVMALGLVLLPLALFADGHGIAALRWIARRFSRRKRSPKRGRTVRASARPRKAPPRAGRPRAPRRARS
jgi:predicted MFS family arabinose efflux permease